MKIRFQCPHCNASLRLAAGQANSPAKCPECDGTFTVPANAPLEPDAETAARDGAGPQKRCATCDRSIHRLAEICPHCGVRQMPPPAAAQASAPDPMGNSTNNNRMAAGICGILIGSLGVHKFILGYTTEGITMVLASLLGGIVTCGISTLVMSVIGIVEGVIYLTKSDEEFHEIYEEGYRGWF